MVHYNAAVYDCRYREDDLGNTYIVFRKLTSSYAGTTASLEYVMDLHGALNRTLVIPWQGGYILNAENMSVISRFFWTKGN